MGRKVIKYYNVTAKKFFMEGGDVVEKGEGGMIVLFEFEHPYKGWTWKLSMDVKKTDLVLEEFTALKELAFVERFPLTRDGVTRCYNKIYKKYNTVRKSPPFTAEQFTEMLKQRFEEVDERIKLCVTEMNKIMAGKVKKH